MIYLTWGVVIVHLQIYFPFVVIWRNVFFRKQFAKVLWNLVTKNNLGKIPEKAWEGLRWLTVPHRQCEYERENIFWIFENPTMDWTLILPFPKTGKYVSNKSASHIGRPPDFCFSDNILLQHLRISVYLKCAQLNLGCFSSGKLFRPFTNFGNRFSDLPLVFFNAIEQREKRGANIPRLMFMGAFTQTRGKGNLAFVTNMELYLVASTLLVGNQNISRKTSRMQGGSSFIMNSDTLWLNTCCVIKCLVVSGPSKETREQGTFELYSGSVGTLSS